MLHGNVLTLHNRFGILLLLFQTELELTILLLELLDPLYQTGMRCSLQ